MLGEGNTTAQNCENWDRSWDGLQSTPSQPRLLASRTSLCLKPSLASASSSLPATWNDSALARFISLVLWAHDLGWAWGCRRYRYEGLKTQVQDKKPHPPQDVEAFGFLSRVLSGQNRPGPRLWPRKG